MKIIFATNNAHKVKEFNEILAAFQLSDAVEIATMGSVGHTTDLPETHETIIENAIEKAEYLFQHYNVSCFSEDTGLEIDFLEGKPGVHTAHYSGTRDPQSNINLVASTNGRHNASNCSFQNNNLPYFRRCSTRFEGICEGTIRQEPSGTEGFGYDPIFQPDGFNTTFAEMDAESKNQVSHRGKATQKLLSFLKERFNA